MVNEEVQFEDIKVGRQVGQDAVVIYRIRYWRPLNENGRHYQEYGGFPEWAEYQGFDVLPMISNRCIFLTGPMFFQLEVAIAVMEEVERRELKRLRDILNELGTKLEVD